MQANWMTGAKRRLMVCVDPIIDIIIEYEIDFIRFIQKNLDIFV